MSCAQFGTGAVSPTPTSGSLTLENLQRRFDDLRAHTPVGPVTARELQTPVRQESLRLGVPRVRSSLRSLFLRDGLNERTSVPILIEDGGRRVLQTGLVTPLPAIEQRVYPAESPAFPYWYVDVVIEADPTPKARDLPGAAVAVLPKQFAEAAVRRSRAGYTFHAGNPGLIVGSTIASRLARAQLIVPTMREWVDTIAAAAGMQAGLSRPGQHAHLLAQRLGSRDALVDLVHTRGALLRPFAYRDPEHPRPSLPAAHGDTLNKTEDVLTLTGIQAAAPNLNLDQIRDTLDLLVEADLLWPGLTLSCRDCQTVAHVRLDQLGNTYRCPRCAALNTLTHHRWDNHGSPADPAWYYDLHPIFRQLLHDHGDVPLLAAAALRSRALTYTDVAEMEFTHIGETKPAFEIDLIAHVDDRLLIVEAKSSNSYKNARDRTASLKKLLEAADLLQADRLVLATTAFGGWSPTDVRAADAEATRRSGVRALDVEALPLTT